MFRRLLPMDHPNTAQAMDNLAMCLLKLGQKDKALKLFNEELGMLQRVFKDDSPAVAGALNNLGYCLAEMERFEESLAAHQDALAMRQRLEAEHWVAHSMNNVGTILVRLGRPDQAVPFLKDCMALNIKLHRDRDSHKSEHYITLGTLGEALSAQGLFPEAEAMLLESCTHLASGPKGQVDDPENGQRAAQRLVKFYQAWDKAEPNKGHDRQAADWQAKLGSPNPGPAEINK
jgi:tetratricopeptide (TPR) repeat protein